MVLGKSVNRDCDADAPKLHPLGGNGDDSAGDHERENIHSAQNGKNAAEFLMSDERLATDQRNVNRLMFADEIYHAVNESVAMEIIELAKRSLAAEVRIAIGITARTGEGAFASDFDGKHGDFTGENIPPGRENFTFGDAWIGTDGGHRQSL